MPEQLDLSVHSDADQAVVRVKGELDAVTAVQLRQFMLEVSSSGPLQVTMDLSQLTFIDSTGLGALIGALKRQRARGGTLTVTGVHGGVLKVFTITQLAETFGITAASTSGPGESERIAAGG